MEVNTIHFASIPSTNIWLKENDKLITDENLIAISADEQTAGRGRFNRTWISPKNKNLYLSFGIAIPENLKQPGILSLILAFSVLKTLDTMGFKGMMKWPNDIFLKGKKISGILGELIHSHGKQKAILGIGLNVNMDETSLGELSRKASSLYLESKKEWDCIEIRKKLIEHFLESITIFFREGFTYFLHFLKQRDFLMGHHIRIMSGDKELSGKYLGVNEDGTASIEEIHEGKKVLYSGDVTVLEY